MKKRYKLESGLDTSITLEIDTEKMNAELASMVNNFWSWADDVLDASEGDIFQAVARRAAGELLVLLLNGYHEFDAVDVLSEREGWPGKDAIGMQIVDYEIPALDGEMFEVTEIAV